MPIKFDEVRGAVARGWCADANRHKEMDAHLAEAISIEIWKLLHAGEAPVQTPKQQQSR